MDDSNHNTNWIYERIATCFKVNFKDQISHQNWLNDSSSVFSDAIVFLK